MVRGKQTVDDMDERSRNAVQFCHWGYRHASRDQFAVRGVDLTIRQGEHVLLLGASGVGKSTMLEGVAGLLGDQTPSPRHDTAAQDDDTRADHEANAEDPQAGDELVADADGGITEGAILVHGVPANQAHGDVGLVLQSPEAQVVFQRLGDNVAFGPENMDVPREEIWPRVTEALDAVGMPDAQLDRSVLHLSGGQMQRVALAGALAMRPGIVLLDEPTANLDPDGADQVVQAVRQALRATQATMILVEHQTARWIDMVDRVVVLGSVEQGTDNQHTVVMADGTPEQIFTNPDLDLESLGVWIPPQYRKNEGTGVLHVEGEPAYSARTGNGRTLLRAEDLSVGHGGRPIAEHISLDLHAGQITALVGTNGAGKSTLSLTLAGLLEPLAGQVVAGDELAAGARGRWPIDWTSQQLASRVSYVFQNPEHQFACGSVMEEMMLGPVRCGVDEDEARQRATTLLRRFHLERYADANPYTLSGGEKRRLTVAAALAAAPRVLILDEPTFGQDRNTWMQIALLIRSLRADDIAIVVVTHDRALVRALDANVVELVPQDGVKEWERAEEDPAHEIAVSSIRERYEEPKPSSHSPVLASTNPVFRLIAAFVVSLPLLLSLDWVSASVAVLLEFAVLWAAGINPLRAIRSTWPIFIGAPCSALAVLLYGKSGGATWWQWGWIHVTDYSALLALATMLRIVAIGMPAIIAVLGIDATDLADGFSQILHLPDRFVYGGLAGIRLFSVLQDDWASLTASRRSRGLGDDNKFKAFFPQAFALLVLSIRRSTMLATAMQARGFGGSGPRSHARVSRVHARDWMLLVVALAVPVIALCAAWGAGTFAFMGNIQG